VSRSDPAKQSLTQVVPDVACTLCGCVCDDLRVTVQGGCVVEAEGACHLARPWYLALHQRQPIMNSIAGQGVALETALDRAAAILASARAPLFYGLSRSSTDGQRAVVALADLLGAHVDTTASLCHASSVMALQETGESTCTLGEARNRADLIIYWGSDPVTSHPRHLERFSLHPAGLFVPEGRQGRTLVVADTHCNGTAEQADLFLPIEPGRDFEALTALRALVRGIPLAPSAPLGAPLELLTDLAKRMRSCRCGVVFFGLGLSLSAVGHRSVEALLQLVKELNDTTRFYARRMRVLGDVSGADSVLAWQTGYPFAVDFSRGYPRYNPGEFSAQDLLERHEIDACVLLGSEDARKFSARALACLDTIPTIVIDAPFAAPAVRADVCIHTAVAGVHLAGTAYRMDEVPIPLRAFLPKDLPSDAEVLEAIQHRIETGSR
jgi:formylmethanofuran dehydrogenase subunit B